MNKIPLIALWKEGKREILAAQAFIKTDYKQQTFTCSDPNCKENLTITKEHMRFTHGKYVWVIPFFAHHSNSTCRLSKESPEHYNKKLVLLSYLFLNKIKINIHGLRLIIQEEEIKGKEIKRENNRADVLLEFKNFNPLFGNGIVFEIMQSETEQSIIEKEKKWLEKAYTVIPIKKNISFEDLASKGIEVDSIYLKKITEKLKTQEERMRELLKNINSPAQQMMVFSETENNCLDCKHGSLDNLDKSVIACWKFKEYNYKKRPDKKDSKMICNFWERGIKKIMVSENE